MWFSKSKRRRRDVPTLDDVPRYPPAEEGLPIVPVARLLDSQSDLIVRLLTPLGQNKDQFAAMTQPVLARYAAFVHLLPASELHHHRGAGGLLRHGLEVAFRAAQLTEDLLVGMDLEPIDRRRAEPLWTFAVFLGGLLHDIGKPAMALSVTDGGGQNTWRPMEESLMAWAQRNAIDRYYLHWRRGEDQHPQRMTMFLAPAIIGTTIWSRLGDGGTAIWEALATALTGEDDGIIYPRVQQADQDSTERDLRVNPGMPGAGAAQTIVPIEHHLRDAMRRLVANGHWKANEQGARVWVFDGDVYIVWNAAVEEITKRLRRDNIPGIPQDKDVLADLLIQRGMALPQETEGVRKNYWRIAPAVLQRDGKKPIKLSMLRLVDPALLFDGPTPDSAERWAPPAETNKEKKSQSRHGEPATTAAPAGADDADRDAMLADQAPPGEPDIDDAWMTQTEAEWRADGPSEDQRPQASRRRRQPARPTAPEMPPAPPHYEEPPMAHPSDTGADGDGPPTNEHPAAAAAANSEHEPSP